MIKMCDLPRYADADMEEIKKIPSRDQIPAEDKWAIEDLYPTDEAWEAELAALAE